jgi:hypothetical protein
MHTRRPAKNTQTDILIDPLDGYSGRQPYYLLSFLLLSRPKPAQDGSQEPASGSAQFDRPKAEKRRPS